jgi:hypothetical protein
MLESNGKALISFSQLHFRDVSWLYYLDLGEPGFQVGGRGPVRICDDPTLPYPEGFFLPRNLWLNTAWFRNAVILF